MQLCSVSQYDVFCEVACRVSSQGQVYRSLLLAVSQQHRSSLAFGQLWERGPKVKLITCSRVSIAIKIIIGAHGDEERENIETEI